MKRLLETMRREGQQILFLERHLQRLTRSAEELGFCCKLSEVEHALHRFLASDSASAPSPQASISGASAPSPQAAQRLRLIVDCEGNISIESFPIEKRGGAAGATADTAVATDSDVATCCLPFVSKPEDARQTMSAQIYCGDRKIDPIEKQIYYKNADRSWYQDLMLQHVHACNASSHGREKQKASEFIAGIGVERELILQNVYGYMTETICGNIVCRSPRSKNQQKSNKGRAEYVTPPVSDGLLNGVFRQVLLEEQIIPLRQAHLTRSELFAAKEEVYSVNSVRGFQRLILIEG